MVIVTEEAKQELGRRLSSAGAEDPEVGLRLTVKEPGQFGLKRDKEREGDYVVQHEGSKVLLVDQRLAKLLKAATIAYEDTPEGKSLVVHK